jgi:UDP-N-acetylmuramoyl-tripeptide--D-alanyl-D-alanine ligase
MAVEPRTLQFVSEACGGRLLWGNAALELARVCTDSRAVQAGDLFVALTGEKFDGHEFLGEVRQKGAAALLVQRPLPAEWRSSGGAIQVENTRRALGQLAVRYRRDFTLPMVAVAGSNGKTTVKELVASVLGQRYATLRSEASFNNDIGVPLTLLKLAKSHQAAVLELGTNHPGELAPLVQMVQPRWGVITTLGREHLEFFHDLAGVVDEEGWLAELLPPHGTLLINGDAPEADRVARRTRAAVVRLGMGPHNDWQGFYEGMDAQGTSFSVHSPQAAYSGRYRLGLLGRHQVANALLAIAVGAQFGLDRAEIERGLQTCRPARMRLQLGEINGRRLLDDAYNANADSMRAALQTLVDLPCTGRRIAVLGEMNELGHASEAAHAEVGRQAAELGVDRLLAVGRWRALTRHAAQAAGLAAASEHETVESAAEALRAWLAPEDLVLIKASRSARFERISDALKTYFLAGQAGLPGLAEPPVSPPGFRA